MEPAWEEGSEFCPIHCVCFFGIVFEMGLLTGGFFLGDRLPPERDETVTQIQDVNDGVKRQRYFFAS
jgi:hypothetical protein